MKIGCEISSLRLPANMKTSIFSPPFGCLCLHHREQSLCFRWAWTFLIPQSTEAVYRKKNKQSTNNSRLNSDLSKTSCARRIHSLLKNSLFKPVAKNKVLLSYLNFSYTGDTQVWDHSAVYSLKHTRTKELKKPDMENRTCRSLLTWYSRCFFLFFVLSCVASLLRSSEMAPHCDGTLSMWLSLGSVKAVPAFSVCLSE